MSEYLIQGETLAGIADAIRGKTGGTDPILTSDMAALIAAIEAGGGDFTSGTTLFSERLTVGNEVSTGYKIEHGLGKPPTFFCFMANYKGSNYGVFLRLFAYCAYNVPWGNLYRIAGSPNSSSSVVETANFLNFSGENETVVYGISSTDVVGPIEYVWVAAAI